MKLTHDKPDDLLLIDGYGDGGFRVAGKRYDGGIQILESGVYPLAATGITDLTAKSMEILLSANPQLDVLLIGTGAQMLMLPGPLRASLSVKGITADPMDTGAAARTYNVLLLEGRRVGAVLLPVE